MTLGEFVQSSFAQRRERLEAAVAKVKAHPGAEEVHQLRTSLRRMQALGRVWPWALEAGSWQEFSRARRKVMQASGEVRDRDNAIALLGENEALAQALAGQRQLWAKALLRRLASLAVPCLADEFPKRAERDAEAYARSLFEKEHESLQKHAAALDEADLEAWHKFRIRAKHCRYTLELLGDLGFEDIPLALSELKTLQDFLGQIQDFGAAQTMARKAAGKAKLIRPELSMLEQKRRELSQQPLPKPAMLF
ncbi:MAG: CHAD domain-containing protein [Bryobacter sp.]|nr:CHAD domain-containing protein [Bryobacter sp.]